MMQINLIVHDIQASVAYCYQLAAELSRPSPAGEIVNGAKSLVQEAVAADRQLGPTKKR
jgi:hypothetical protein